MKRYLIITAIMLFSASAFAQKTVNYCDLDVYKPGFKNYVAVPDYGVKHKRLTMADAIKDNTGKTMKFATEIEALNYIVKEGWELVSTNRNHGSETHFYLKKVN